MTYLTEVVQDWFLNWIRLERTVYQDWLKNWSQFTKELYCYFSLSNIILENAFLQKNILL